MPVSKIWFIFLKSLIAIILDLLMAKLCHVYDLKTVVSNK